MFSKKWCSKHSWNNFHMKTHVLNTFSISRCSERSDFPNTLGTISIWKLTFWTLFPFQDVLKEVIFQTLLEQFPYENSRFEHFFHFKVFWKKMFQTLLEQFPYENSRFEHFFHFKMFWKKWCSTHSWNSFHMKTHVSITSSMSRCSERSDVPNTLGTISVWKLTFWTLFPFQDVLKEVMFQTLLEQFPYENSRFEHFFHFKMFWKKRCSKHSWNNFHMKTHVWNTFSISRCSERSDVPNTLGTISIWKLTFWTLFPFQDVLKEVMFQTLLEKFPYENSRFEHGFHVKMFWRKWCSQHAWNNFHMKTHVLNTFSISKCSERSDVPNTLGTNSIWKLTFWTLFSMSRCSERSDVPNTLGTISIWKLTFWTLFPFQDVLKEVMFQTLLEQFPYENSRFEHFFHFKMFWKKWCSKHSWNNFHLKTHVLNTFSMSRCSERSDVPNTPGTISIWKLTFSTLFPFQDVLKEVMFQTLLEQFPFENSRFEHFFHFKMFWKKWCSKHSWNNFHMKTHVLNTFSISRCSERSDVPNTLGTISIWKLTFWTLLPFQDVLKEVMFQTLLEQFPYENSRFEHCFHFKMFWKKWCSKHSWNNFHMKTHVLNTFSISRCSERSDVPNTLGTISIWKLTFWTLFPFQDVLKEVMFQTLLEQFPYENSRFQHFFHFKMFWKKWCSKHSWNNFQMKTHVLNTFSMSRCSERSDVPNTLGTISIWKLTFWTLLPFQDVLKEVMFQTLLEQFPYENLRYEHFFLFKMFWKKWCSKHSWNNFHMKTHVFNTFSISRCSERSDVPNTLGTISIWKLTFSTLFPFQDVLKEVMFQTLLEPFPYENSRFEHFFHFKMFWKKRCSKHSWSNFQMKTHVLNTFSISRCSERSDVPNTLGTISNSRFEHFFHFKMFWKKWCSKHSWNNFHLKTHVLNTSSISRCSERSDVPNTLGTISIWKLTFGTLFPFQDVLKEVMFPTLLEQFPFENSRFEHFFHFKMFWKKWWFQTLLEQFPYENSRFEHCFHFKMFWKKWCSKHSWNNFHMKTHVLNTFSISRCSERSDVPNAPGTISIWKLTFWTLFPFQDVLKEVMFQTLLEQLPFENSSFEHFFHFKMFWKKWWFQTLLEQFPYENSRFAHFFHFKMFWKKWCSKHSWNNCHLKTHVLNTFSISRCSERSDVPNTLGTISIWKLTFWTLFPFQDVLKEVMFQTLLEQFPFENSRFEHFFHFKMFWKKWCSKHSWNNCHLKTHVLNTFSISRCSERSDVPNTLGTISIWKLTFWTLFPFQDVLKEVMFQTLLEQFPYENSRFEHFFPFKMFCKKRCSKHSWNNFQMKTRVLKTSSISRCSERSDVPNTLGTISIWKLTFWTLYPFQDVLKEVMFQTLLEQFPYENSRFEHFFHFKMFWKKWCSKHSWNNFHLKTHVLNTFSISRCSERSDVPNTLGTISIWKLTFSTLFPFQDVLKEVMFQTLLEHFPYENSRFEHFFHFKMFWKKWCSKHSWNNFHMKTHVWNTFSISRCSERSDVPNTVEHFVHFKMFWKKWCSKHSWNNFHMKTHVLITFSISRCSERSDVPNTLGTIAIWKLTFWTLLPFQDVLKEGMFQTLLEQFPYENSRFEHFFLFKMFWKKWCSKHSWNNFHMKTHVLNTFSISRCSERSDVPNTLGTISIWKLTFGTLFPFQDVLQEVMFQTLLEQFPYENSRFEHFFHFKMFWKKWCSKHSWNNFHLKTHVLNTFSISRCSERSAAPNTLGTISIWKLTFSTLFPFQDVLKKVMFQTLLEQFPFENSRFEHFFHFKMFWKKWCSKHSWNNFRMKTHVLNTSSISRCSERSDVPNTLGTISIWKLTFGTLFPFQDVLKEVMFQTLLEQFPSENSRFEHFFHFKMFWKKWCSKHSWNNFHMKTHVLNTSSISRCSERSDVPNSLGTISIWKLTFWTLLPFQDVLKEVMFQTLLEQFPFENSRFEHFFHFKMFWKKWCSKHSWNNFHMKTHVLNTFSISRFSERSDVPNTLGTISIWKLTFWHFFHFKMFWKKRCSKHSWNNFHMKTHVLKTFSMSRCSGRSDVPNTLGTISIWKLTFWTLFPFQDVLKEAMFQTLLEQFPFENSRFEHFFHFKMFWKKWCSKHSWNNFHLKTHVLNTSSISRCSERSDVPNTLGTISIWKLTFWTLFPFQDVLKEVMFQTLLEQLPFENSRFEHYFHFKMFWKKRCSKHSWNNFHVKTHVLNASSISRCSERSDVPNTLGTISIWKLTFWTLFPFQDVLKEVMFQTLLEQFPYENSRFEHFFHFKMFWKKWCSKHSWHNFHMKTHVLNTVSISRCSERSDVPNTLGTISTWKPTFWTLLPFQDVLKEVMFQTLLEQFPYENSRFEHFFHIKMFWKKWCSKHSWNNFHLKTRVLNTSSISRCSERSDVPNTLGTISIWKLTFWTLFPFQDVLKEVMFQTLLEQFPYENSRLEHCFHFKMFWKKWCSKHSWNNFHMKIHVLNTFSISRCSERSDVPNTLGTISIWKLTFWTLFPFQDVLKEVMFQALLEQFPYENSRFEHFLHFKMFWKKWCSKHSWNNFRMKTHVLNTFSISGCSEGSDVPNTLGTISIWKLTFWTLFPCQDVLKEVMFQTLLEQLPFENSRFEHFFHFKMFWKKWCSKHSWNNFHMKTHVLNTFSISRCSERSDVPNTLGTISIWKLTFWTLFHFKMFWKKWCSKHSWNNFHMKTHVLNTFPCQDVLKEVMFQTLLEQFPHENSRFEHFFHVKMFWKKWCSKHSWNHSHLKTHVLNTSSISRCSERSDVPNTLGTISIWKLTFWTLCPFQDVLKEVMFQTLLEQFPYENSRFEHFFHFKMFWKKWCSKHSWNNSHMKTHVLHTFSISRCSERSDVPNTLGKISIWTLTFWTLFPFQDVLKEVMFQTLLEQFPYENSRFEHFFHFKMFWKKWCSKHSWNNFHMKTHVLNTSSISRSSERSDVPNTLGTISIWKLTFWTLFPFQDVLKEAMFQTLLEQFPHENSRFEHFFHFKMFWKKWCSKHSWNNFHMKTHVLNTFPFQDVLKEVMFQTLLEQFPYENSRFEHFSMSRCSERSDVPNTLGTISIWKLTFWTLFHFKMFWKKWCSKHSWNNFHMKTHVLNTFSISRCSERSDIPNTLGTISTWKLTFGTLFPFQDVLKEVMFQTPLE